MLFFLVISCTSTDVKDSGETTVVTTENNVEFAITWLPDGIDIDIIYGDLGVWWFGIQRQVVSLLGLEKTVALEIP